MTGKLINKRELCPNTFEFTFELPEPLSFTSGQYVFVTLTQFNIPDDRGPRRHFSILNAPSNISQVKIATRIRETGFKQTLNTLAIGETVDISKPYGEFVLSDDIQKPLVFIAGGIGITPFMSMLNWMKENDKKTPITLLFSNKSKDTTPFFTELESLARELSDFQLIMSMTQDETWTGEKGRIDAAKIQKYVPDLSSPMFYIVGPEEMNQAVEDILNELSVPEDHIKREDFTGY